MPTSTSNPSPADRRGVCGVSVVGLLVAVGCAAGLSTRPGVASEPAPAAEPAPTPDAAPGRTFGRVGPGRTVVEISSPEAPLPDDPKWGPVAAATTVPTRAPAPTDVPLPGPRSLPVGLASDLVASSAAATSAAREPMGPPQPLPDPVAMELAFEPAPLITVESLPPVPGVAALGGSAAGGMSDVQRLAAELAERLSAPGVAGAAAADAGEVPAGADDAQARLSAGTFEIKPLLAAAPIVPELPRVEPDPVGPAAAAAVASRGPAESPAGSPGTSSAGPAPVDAASSALAASPQTLGPARAGTGAGSASADTAAVQAWPVRTVLALAGVVGLILALAWLARRMASTGAMGLMGPAKAPSGVLEMLGRYPVGPKQSLVLLRFDRRVLLCQQSGGGRGTPASMTTLAELTDPEDVASVLVKTRSGVPQLTGQTYDRAAAQADLSILDNAAEEAAAETVIPGHRDPFAGVGGTVSGGARRGLDAEFDRDQLWGQAEQDGGGRSGGAGEPSGSLRRKLEAMRRTGAVRG